MSGRCRSIVCHGLIACAILAATGVASSAAALSKRESFPCRWNYDLYVGLHRGLVTGGAAADCTGVAGKLTVAARLYGWSPEHNVWRLDRAATRSWTDPSGNRYVELSEPCRTGKNRAVYTWLLRDRAGRLVAHQVVRTAPVSDSGATCAYVLK